MLSHVSLYVPNKKLWMSMRSDSQLVACRLTYRGVFGELNMWRRSLWL